MGSGNLTYVADEWTDCSQYSVLGNLLLYKAYPWKQSVMGIRPGVYLYNLSTGETKTLIAPDSMRTGVVSLLDEKTALIAARMTPIKIRRNTVTSTIWISRMDP